MAERKIRQITETGKVTLPKELRVKHEIKDYVEIVDSGDGILIKKLK